MLIDPVEIYNENELIEKLYADNVRLMAKYEEANFYVKLYKRMVDTTWPKYEKLLAENQALREDNEEATAMIVDQARRLNINRSDRIK